MKKLAAEWIEKAEEDFFSASHLAGVGRLTPYSGSLRKRCTRPRFGHAFSGSKRSFAVKSGHSGKEDSREKENPQTSADQSICGWLKGLRKWSG